MIPITIGKFKEEGSSLSMTKVLTGVEMEFIMGFA